MMLIPGELSDKTPALVKLHFSMRDKNQIKEKNNSLHMTWRKIRQVKDKVYVCMMRAGENRECFTEKR
jgi:hypothetical protein